MKTQVDEGCYQKKWESEKTYSYNPVVKKSNTYIIDTPPPTISGALHIGHVFSYTQTDILARFQRMQGKNVFYPMGWDNNGLPTERRVQNLYKITCDPLLSGKEDPDLKDILSRKEAKKLSGFLPVSRKNFIHVCSRQTKEDQKQYEQLWRSLGLSVDWTKTYETISPHSQIISQKSFLDLYKKGFVENRHTPVFWDTQFKTAVAQADMEDRTKQGFYYDIKFQVQGGKGDFVISTTRPELLPACVAVAAHPEDERYKKFFYQKALTPLFSAPVPVLPSPHADPEKGTGILMICTFGDMEDVRFWEQQGLPLKQIISPDGFLKQICFESLGGESKGGESKGGESKGNKGDIFLSLQPEKAGKYYSQLKGLRVQQARKKIVEILRKTSHLVSEPKATEQFVKFYEKGDYPLELIPARQWYIKILQYKKELLEQGGKINWHPPAMLKRYEQWVEGLNQDWCISRQRFFGVPFPVWYPLDQNKAPDYSRPILPLEGNLFGSSKKDLPFSESPVDPMSTAPSDWNPKGYTEDQRGKSFIADTAVMDTWATSSLTPQISSHWGLNHERHNRLFPADLRPQAHEIIRTWAFYTIVKSFFHSDPKEKQIPWTDIAVSGWVMDPERKKMSKSKAGKKTVLSPEDLIKEYSADAVRYWAGRARLGMDTVYDENVFKAGAKLRLKLGNAFKFVEIQVKAMLSFFNECQKRKREKDFNFLSTIEPFVFEGGYNYSSAKVEHSFLKGLLRKLIHSKMDKAWLVYLLGAHRRASSFLKKLHYSQALDTVEKAFWLFCDNYLELVKGRAYRFTHFENFLKAGEKIKVEEVQKAQSAVCALDLSLYIFVKLFAPYMPYITEHIWSKRYRGTDQQIKNEAVKPVTDKTSVASLKEEIRSSSVHTSFWDLPNESELLNLSDPRALKQKDGLSQTEFSSPTLSAKTLSALLELSFNLLEQIRSQKALQKKSLSTPVKELKIQIKDTALFAFCREDIARASHTDLKNIFVEQAPVATPKVSLILKT